MKKHKAPTCASLIGLLLKALEEIPRRERSKQQAHQACCISSFSGSSNSRQRETHQPTGAGTSACAQLRSHRNTQQHMEYPSGAAGAGPLPPCQLCSHPVLALLPKPCGASCCVFLQSCSILPPARLWRDDNATEPSETPSAPAPSPELHRAVPSPESPCWAPQLAERSREGLLASREVLELVRHAATQPSTQK